MKKYLKILLGLVLAPSFFCLYLLDRIYLLPLIWLSAHNVNFWYKKPEQIGSSFIRVIAISIINLILYLIFF
jgi:hypothetical protein